MAKKPKLVAPAPNVVPPPPEVVLTPFEILNNIWTRRKTNAQRVISDFRAAMAADPDDKITTIGDYIEWNAEKVFRAEAFLYLETRGMDGLLAEQSTAALGVWVVKERVEAAFERCINDLTGLHLGGGGEGPWRHNGSAALHNVNNLSKCDAKREALALYREMLEAIDAMDTSTAPAP